MRHQGAGIDTEGVKVLITQARWLLVRHLLNDVPAIALGSLLKAITDLERAVGDVGQTRV